ncbi:hypothetical protein [Mitsuokella sp. AF21-1AC]|uniref:hypothetical protein n=1 Tax=Mitsuokella sp. AF21-1AC TaxID=2292235 RepID=UPI000E498CB5|nr:hypothetical protein [Mitsuokella sp. AF21-1AC]RGS72017.1 hypothetical protein DWX75_07415 [Mitsuokella sp. AF21-1AC]
MGLWKGFKLCEVLEGNKRTLITVLSEQLALTNQALEGMSEEMKVVQKDRRKLEDRVGKLEARIQQLEKLAGVQEAAVAGPEDTDDKGE